MPLDEPKSLARRLLTDADLVSGELVVTEVRMQSGALWAGPGDSTSRS